MYKLIINLKTYVEGENENALKIAKICSSLASEAKKKNVEIVLCCSAFELKEVARTRNNVYAQHIDPIDFGAHTGFIVPKEVKILGAKGTLLNHSEHQISFEVLKKSVIKAREAGLEVCICARTAKVAKKVAKLKPDYIAVEPKELIGGDISISTAKPKLITDSKKAVGKVSLLVGAGVKNAQDVRVGIKLGAKGVLVASGVVKAKNPKTAIKDLLSGF